MNGDRPTIFAPSTAAGRAAVAIVRISGPRAAAALETLSGRPCRAPRVAMRTKLRDPANGEKLDEALALWFPAPKSFTGEDVVELHIHGGRAVLQGVLAALGRMTGLRLAEQGEFTRRAFDSGKLDLAEVEGLADLIAAETESQRRQALRQLSGELGRAAEAWRKRLVQALAHAEAEIDFPDEDLPGELIAKLAPEIEALAAEIGRLLDDRRRGEILRDGVSIAIIGPPNAGKSSLLNLLARRDAAIVSAIAGTTRDVIEAQLDLGGYPAVVADTAGLREQTDTGPQSEIEREGMRRAIARAEAADLKILVLDATEAVIDPAVAKLADAATLVVANKIDAARTMPALHGHSIHAISAKTGAGLNLFLGVLQERLAALIETTDTSAPLITRERHRAALEACMAALARARAGTASELIAEDLRLAARALGRIAGRVDVDDVLDVIFREFCIGK